MSRSRFNSTKEKCYDSDVSSVNLCGRSCVCATGDISAASADYPRTCQAVCRKEWELTRRAAAIYRDSVVTNRLAPTNATGRSNAEFLATGRRCMAVVVTSHIDGTRAILASIFSPRGQFLSTRMPLSNEFARFLLRIRFR